VARGAGEWSGPGSISVKSRWRERGVRAPAACGFYDRGAISRGRLPEPATRATELENALGDVAAGAGAGLHCHGDRRTRSRA